MATESLLEVNREEWLSPTPKLCLLRILGGFDGGGGGAFWGGVGFDFGGGGGFSLGGGLVRRGLCKFVWEADRFTVGCLIVESVSAQVVDLNTGFWLCGGGAGAGPLTVISSGKLGLPPEFSPFSEFTERLGVTAVLSFDTGLGGCERLPLNWLTLNDELGLPCLMLWITIANGGFELVELLSES